jgi:hypothetical protein
MVEYLANASFQIEDDKAEITSADIPFKFTGTLISDIATFIAALGVAIDGVTDGAIRKVRVCLLFPLPVGGKAAPVANSDNEETGLITWNVTGSANKYGVDIPAWYPAGFTGGEINLSATNVANFTSLLDGPTGTCTPVDRYGNPYTTISQAVKTFRKHRRALSRS